MSCSNKLTPAEQSRLDYQILRTHSARADLVAPEPHLDNPFLPDLPGDVNQLHFDFQGLPFKVVIPRWDAADDTFAVPGVVTLLWDGTPETAASARYPFITPLDSGILFIELELPANRTDVHGEHQLSYHIVQGGNHDFSTPLAVNIDRLPPVTGGPVTVPQDIVDNGITKTYLDANGFVPLAIPNYSVAAVGDVIYFYYGASYPGDLVGTFTRTDLTTPITAQLTAAEVGGVEGEHLIYYYIADRKGNLSATSQIRRVNVVLTDPPVGLLAPDIPLDSDSLIDLADAQTPVGAGIVAQYTNYVANRDELVMVWDGQRQPAKPINSFPVYADIPFRDVFNGNPGEKDVTVSYDIKRGSIYYPSPPKTVRIDLRKPGSVIDPDNPGPPNPNLAVPNLKGASGTNLDNVLTAADSGRPVTVKVDLFNDADSDDFVQLVYNGVPVSDADGGIVTLVTPPFPNPLEFDVRWSVIEAVGNGNPILLNYIVGHPLNSNVDISRPQQITVDIVPEVVPQPVFINLDPDVGWLNCGSLRQHPVRGTVVHVLIGPDSRLANQTLAFTYQGYEDDLATTERPGTYFSFSYSPDTQEAEDGFIVAVDYAPVLLTSLGYAKVAYLARVNGQFVRAESPVVTVYMRRGGGGSCLIPPPL